MRRREVVCQQWVELVTAYLDGSMPRGLRRAVDRHLAACAGCRAYLDQIRATIALTGRITEGEVPAEVIDALEAAFADYRGTAGSSE